MTAVYYPKGVCSQRLDLELENGIIKNIQFYGGCGGNLTGISKLVQGKKAEDVIALLKGTKCGYKSTSCPDQLAIALEKAVEYEKNAEKGE